MSETEFGAMGEREKMKVQAQVEFERIQRQKSAGNSEPYHPRKQAKRECVPPSNSLEKSRRPQSVVKEVPHRPRQSVHIGATITRNRNPFKPVPCKSCGKKTRKKDGRLGMYDPCGQTVKWRSACRPSMTPKGAGAGTFLTHL